VKILLFITMFFGSIIQGATGLGFAIFSMPILTLILPIRIATLVVLLSAFIMVLWIFYRMRDYVIVKLVSFTVIGELIGRSIGIYSLMNLGTSILKNILGVTLIIFSLYFTFYYNKIRINISAKNSFIVGIISGIFGGMFNIGGPPKAIYFFAATSNKMEYQGCLQATNVITTIYSIFLHLTYGNIDLKILQLSILGMIAVLMGTPIGLKIFKEINKSLLSKFISFLMIIMGVMLII